MGASGQGGALNEEKEQSRESEGESAVTVVLSVAFYIIAAIVMVMVNKAVLNAIPVPMFFLFCQLAIAVVLLQGTSALGYYATPRLSVQTVKDVAPLIAINCVGLVFNTYCLKYVDASFYQVARGLVLPFTVLFSYLLLSAHCSKPVLASVILVCVGFFWGVSGESLKGSNLGISLGILSSLTTSVHAIVIKKSLNSVQGSTLALAYLNNLLSAICVLPLVIIMGEWDGILDLFSSEGGGLSTFLWGTVVTGVFGFLINLAGFLSIKVTSPVSHMISAAVRGVIQTGLGVLVFGDVITSDRFFGIVFILGGSVWYTYAKSQENAKPASILPSMASSPATPLSAYPPYQNPAQFRRTPGISESTTVAIDDRSKGF